MKLMLGRFLALVVALALCHPGHSADTHAPYRAPRLPDGHADMEGMWKNSDLTPMERPPGITTLQITAQDAARLTAAYLAPATAANSPDDPGRDLEGRQFEPIRGRLRSSLIIDPADGKIPWLDGLREKAATVRPAVLTVFDNPEQRPSSERCLASTGAPPMMPRADANTYQIAQTAATTLIVSEFISDARLIRMNSSHSPAAITSWLGDSVGHWEGDTLVVETRNFASSSSIRQDPRFVFFVSPQTFVVERFTRVSADEINYLFTVTDAGFYSRPWTGEAHLSRTLDRMFEMACHEGNYSMRNILEAARQHEVQTMSAHKP
jgi:hypothetical protein